MGDAVRVEVARRRGGSWVVLLDGQVISDHATHVAARRAAIQHQEVGRAGG